MNRSKPTRIDVLTLFPTMFDGPLTESLLGRAVKNRLVDFHVVNLRDYSEDAKHHKVDDRPYGGGAGMVLQAEPIFRALKDVAKKGRQSLGKTKPYVIFLSPQGCVLNQTLAAELVKKKWIVLLCGHYEGIDERLMDFVDAEVSIGDIVLTGGEIPAMVVADAVVRLIPGVVKESDSIQLDSFQNGLLDYPHYTRPAVWRGKKVPEILLSGDHAKIAQWRQEQALQATRRKRPELLARERPRRVRHESKH
jgi:tRNA (guanine37-N1)-methyltransferase